ncbi:MAG: hypothetical protein HUU20_06920 [Pirellulales bacterium]|nr:hypothetical protein [Pirellulales bacterium]
MMIRQSVEHSLPEPEFEQRAGEFAVRVSRDWPTEQVVAALDLNERQIRALSHLKAVGRISNQEYQQITGATKKTASRDLADIVAKGVVQRVGTTGRGAFYVLARKGDIKGTKGGTKGTSTDTAESGRKRLREEGVAGHCPDG